MQQITTVSQKQPRHTESSLHTHTHTHTKVLPSWEQTRSTFLCWQSLWQLSDMWHSGCRASQDLKQKHDIKFTSMSFIKVCLIHAEGASNIQHFQHSTFQTGVIKVEQQIWINDIDPTDCNGAWWLQVQSFSFFRVFNQISLLYKSSESMSHHVTRVRTLSWP